jgi:hypothetical protein
MKSLRGSGKRHVLIISELFRAAIFLILLCNSPNSTTQQVFRCLSWLVFGEDIFGEMLGVIIIIKGTYIRSSVND